jgi:hypothetical protein
VPDTAASLSWAPRPALADSAAADSSLSETGAKPTGAEGDTK